MHRAFVGLFRVSLLGSLSLSPPQLHSAGNHCRKKQKVFGLWRYTLYHSSCGVYFVWRVPCHLRLVGSARFRHDSHGIGRRVPLQSKRDGRYTTARAIKEALLFCFTKMGSKGFRHASAAWLCVRVNECT